MARQRREPDEGWGWTSLCSAVSTSWPRSWFLWRWDHWPHWWAGLREWCIFQAWCHSWVACTHLSAWCTTCPPLRVSLPKARPSHYWHTFNQTPSSFSLNSPKHWAARTPSLSFGVWVRCTALIVTDTLRIPPHTVTALFIYTYQHRSCQSPTDRQTLATSLPSVKHDPCVHTVCVPHALPPPPPPPLFQMAILSPLNIYWNSKVWYVALFWCHWKRLGLKSCKSFSVFLFCFTICEKSRQ